jgi:elongation factor Ts
MSVISASMVAKLRSQTGAPMMECKKALTESAGDMEQAEQLLRVKLGAKASKAADRITADGLISVAVTDQVTAMVELNCETDFVTKNEDFIILAEATANLIATHKPTDIHQLGNLPCQLLGFGSSLEDVRKGLVGKIGENMSFRRFHCIVSDQVASYIHNGRIGVLVHFTGDKTIAKDIAMHIAAMKPIALTSDSVPAALIEKERQVASAKASESGKPPAIVEKMVEGAVQKFLKEVSLLNQPFVKNDKLTIAQLLEQNRTTVEDFVLYVVGEGIEKKQDNFADEVAAQVATAQQV